jgi:hypothetical protein
MNEHFMNEKISNLYAKIPNPIYITGTAYIEPNMIHNQEGNRINQENISFFSKTYLY